MAKVGPGSLLVLALVITLAACGKDPPPPKAPADSPPPAVHPAPPAGSGAGMDLSGIAKAGGGKTVAEIYAEKAELAGKKVTVRGRIVKANAMIMDRNWLHVRDGTGAGDTSDLTVTSSGDPPKVGDTVVVTGQVSVNKDFGLGYQYPVIIEDAEVTVE